jgi:hypothetical protein
MLTSQLRMAEVRAVDDNKVDLAFFSSAEPSRELVAKPDNFKLIQGALQEHYRANLTIRLSVDPKRKMPRLASEKQQKKGVDPASLMEDSPRLKKLMEKVEGEIVGVKKT